ncbi:hypothetical protein CEXT_229281 [Caerostris extrusa]|uniref:Uncharacterized protein n=1 Tax=Caerostris extrusa TaxID=172846 RepID=A0AAV4NSW8_CAEEX|nr:hypothetical protein CEXT_229281 [Caerostris extrusa]
MCRGQRGLMPLNMHRKRAECIQATSPPPTSAFLGTCIKLTTRINSQKALKRSLSETSICFKTTCKRSGWFEGAPFKAPKIAFTIDGSPKTPTKQLSVWGIQDLCKSCSIDESNRELVDPSRALGDSPPINKYAATVKTAFVKVSRCDS